MTIDGTITISAWRDEATPGAIAIWNEVLREGVAFPQEDELDLDAGRDFFAAQSRTAIARDGDGRALGLYILHPNNVGRCGHLCNASYAVASWARGRGVGEALVRDCLSQARALGFGVLQFNAVVATNIAALRLYEKLGFVRLGTIPRGFRLRNGQYADIIPHYRALPD